MTEAPVRLEVEDRGVALAIAALRSGLGHAEPAWEETGRRMLDAATPLVPVASGALVDSLIAQPRSDGVEVSSDLSYAGVQDRGWPARNIEGQQFMEAAEVVAPDAAVGELTAFIDDLIDRVGLS